MVATVSPSEVTNHPPRLQADHRVRVTPFVLEGSLLVLVPLKQTSRSSKSAEMNLHVKGRGARMVAPFQGDEPVLDLAKAVSLWE